MIPFLVLLLILLLMVGFLVYWGLKIAEEDDIHG